MVVGIGMDGGDEGSEKMIDTAMRTVTWGARTVKRIGTGVLAAIQIALFLASLAVVLPCVMILCWFALWIGTAFFDAQLSYSIGSWGREMYEAYVWVRVCSVLLVVGLGCLLYGGALSSAIRPETEEERRQRFINDDLVAQRQRGELQLGCR